MNTPKPLLSLRLLRKEGDGFTPVVLTFEAGTKELRGIAEDPSKAPLPSSPKGPNRILRLFQTSGKGRQATEIEIDWEWKIVSWKGGLPQASPRPAAPALPAAVSRAASILGVQFISDGKGGLVIDPNHLPGPEAMDLLSFFRSSGPCPSFLPNCASLRKSFTSEVEQEKVARNGECPDCVYGDIVRKYMDILDKLRHANTTAHSGN